MLGMTELGRVAAIWRYPVKSMAGESLTEVDVSWKGSPATAAGPSCAMA